MWWRLRASITLATGRKHLGSESPQKERMTRWWGAYRVVNVKFLQCAGLVVTPKLEMHVRGCTHAGGGRVRSD